LDCLQLGFCLGLPFEQPGFELLRFGEHDYVVDNGRKVVGVVAACITLLPFDLGNEVFLAEYFIAALTQVIYFSVIDCDENDAVV